MTCRLHSTWNYGERVCDDERAGKGMGARKLEETTGKKAEIRRGCGLDDYVSYTTAASLILHAQSL